MFADIFSLRETSLGTVVGDALTYFRRYQLPDGSIAEDPQELVFHNWDTVNALKVVGLWRDRVSFDDDGMVDRMFDYLRSCEKPTGMISWGQAESGQVDYCVETSSEYIEALVRLGRSAQAANAALFLRSRQLPSGDWEIGHSHMPKGFQVAPSVTGFALLALRAADVEPLRLDEALDALVGSQKAEGHFGVNRLYHYTHYYLARPTLAILSSYGYHAQVAAARDFVLATQRGDGSWGSPAEQNDSVGTPLVTPEMCTGLALECLAYAGMSTEDAPVRRGVSWLIGRRRADGSWDGGRYPYPAREGYPDVRSPLDVYTTAQVLSAFNQLVTVEESP